jgi:hypothetical protein
MQMFTLVKDVINDMRQRTVKRGTRLNDLDIWNISAVARPANGRPWLVTKSASAPTQVHLNLDGSIVARASEQKPNVRSHVLNGLFLHFNGRIETIDGLLGRSEAERNRLKQAAVAELVARVQRDTNLLPNDVGYRDGLSTVGEMIGDDKQFATLRSTIGQIIATPEGHEDTQKSPVHLANALLAFRKTEQHPSHATAGIERSDRMSQTPIDDLRTRLSEAASAHPTSSQVELEMEVFKDLKFAREFADYVEAAGLEKDPDYRGSYDRARGCLMEATVTKASATAAMLHEIQAVQKGGTTDPTAFERYDQYRRENTYALSGSTLADRTVAKGSNASDEVAKRVKQMVSKDATLDVGVAMHRVFTDDPALYDRVRREFPSV